MRFINENQGIKLLCCGDDIFDWCRAFAHAVDAFEGDKIVILEDVDSFPGALDKGGKPIEETRQVIGYLQIN